MNKNIFSICGYSCAGKSTVITRITNAFGLVIIRYGDIHREAIKRSGYKLGMDWVKDKGFEEYEDGALEVFKQKIKNCPCENIIIDGIFSKKCFNFLKEQDNINLTNILLQTTFENRLNRMIEREGYSFEEAMDNLKSVDWLKFNSGLYEIMRQANYIIDSSNDKIEVTSQVVEIIGDVMRTQEKEYR